jgi:hypothetical protein
MGFVVCVVDVSTWIVMDVVAVVADVVVTIVMDVVAVVANVDLRRVQILELLPGERTE